MELNDCGHQIKFYEKSVYVEKYEVTCVFEITILKKQYIFFFSKYIIIIHFLIFSFQDKGIVCNVTEKKIYIIINNSGLKACPVTLTR